MTRDRYRLLSTLGLLNSQPDPSLDRLVRIAAAAARTPTALITFVGPDVQWIKARTGWHSAYTPLVDAFCPWAVQAHGLMEVPDALLDSRFRENVLVTGPDTVRFYAGQPIVFEQVALGTVCVLDTRPRRLQPPVRAILEDLSGLVADLLHRRSEEFRRIAEEQRALDFAKTAGEWFWETDDRHCLTWVSAGFEAKTGIAPAAVIGKPIDDAMLVDFRGDALDPPVRLKKLMDRRNGFSDAMSEMMIFGEARVVSRSAVPFTDREGRYAGHRGATRDVTDRVRVEQLAAQRDKAERSNRAKSEVLSRTSHEIRTPLNAIMGFGQLMAMDDAGPNALAPVQRERLSAIQLASEHLLRLINDMLDLARIEQGATALKLEPVDAYALSQAAQVLVSPAAQAQRVALRCGLRPGQVVALADERALGQVVLNLLSNAVKYNRLGGEVHVDGHVDGEYAELRVQDTGIGLTDEQLAGLYEPFNRLGAEAGPATGSGLGLVICKALVENMGGELHIASRRNVGTTATVKLKRAAADAEAT